MNRFTDLAVQADSENIYDLVVDEDTRDFVTTDGLESSQFVSLFTDRRARADEVADPLKRRGWIGDLVSDIPGDIIGSGLWLYEQRRLTADVAAGVRLEAEAALQWMVPDIAKPVVAEVVRDPVARSVSLLVRTSFPTGGQSTKSYVLATATRAGLLARL